MLGAVEDKDGSQEQVVLIPELPEKKLDRVCLRMNRGSGVCERALGFYLHDMEARGAYQLLGFSSAVHYATVRLDLSRSRAQQILGAGRALAGLRAIDKVLRRATGLVEPGAHARQGRDAGDRGGVA